MTANFLWGSIQSVKNLLTTELNSLADGSATAYGPEIDNSAGWQMGLLKLLIASNSLAFTTASLIRVFFVPSLNGLGGGSAIYPTFTSGASYKLAESNYLSGVIAINPATQSANAVNEGLPFVPMPPGYFKTIAVSRAGVTLPSSGSALDLYPTPTQY